MPTRDGVTDISHPFFVTGADLPPIPSHFAGVPFSSALSLAPLVAFCERVFADNRGGIGAFLTRVYDYLAEAPELLEPIDDLGVIRKHREFIDLLMTVVFPPAFWDRDYSAAIVPFQFTSFYATPRFTEHMLNEDGTMKMMANIDSPALQFGKALTGYLQILNKFHGIRLELDYPIIFTTSNSATGLVRHFKMNFDLRFVDIVPLKEVTPLTEEQKGRLMKNLTDLDVWRELIPPENFQFRGFSLINAVDVTDQEVLSSLRKDLIRTETIISSERFNQVQEKLRILLKRPEIVLGIAAIEGDQVMVLNFGDRVETGCVFADSTHYAMSDLAGSIYERAIVERRMQIIDDLTLYPNPSPTELGMMAKGFRNLLVAPLYAQDALIGALHLSSPNPDDLNAINSLKLLEVLELFSAAVKRTRDDLNNRVQTIIREKYTAIHPSVEWRFRKAALNFMRRQYQTSDWEAEPIVFDNVYPLFAMSDIRGSSVQRALAIQADLVEQLELARDVLELAHAARPMPVLDNLARRIDRSVNLIKSGLHAGDEATMIDFLQREVETLFDHLSGFGSAVRMKVEEYRAAIDPALGILYRRRRSFEESVTNVNRAISAYIDEEEAKAQEIFPHYFEKHQTDGVDFGIYVGASLVEQGEFHPVYLKNLRLWQFMVMCGVARLSDRIKWSLKLPLETAHLILVQHSPLSIRFRHDEKQFDVDGAYNIRYEIVKKRIDKATIKGTSERLTRPNKVAIVYSHPREAAEYREYIEYLTGTGHLTGAIEELELEELQGVQGLRALRVSVAPVPPASDEIAADADIVPEEIARAVRAMSGFVSSTGIPE